MIMKSFKEFQNSVSHNHPKNLEEVVRSPERAKNYLIIYQKDIKRMI